MARYNWRKLPDTSDFPPGLADLIREAHILVVNGQEWAGIFIHDDDKCWFGYKPIGGGPSRSVICENHDEAVRKVEALYDAGMIVPKRRARF